MSSIDIDQLLAPVSADAPAGADVEFDPAYFELEKLAQGTPESVMGDEVKPAEEPEWRDVRKAALGLLDFERRLREADAAIAGEGRIDSQSLEGKIVGQIAETCARAGRDLHVVVGRDELDRAALGGLPIRSIREAGTLEALRAAGREIAIETDSLIN